MLVALEPIRSAVGIRRINVATHGTGSDKKGIEELAGQTARLLNAPHESSVYLNKSRLMHFPRLEI